MKVIFLDIDGVLNTDETYDRIEQDYRETGIRKILIDEFRVEYLKQIVECTGAKIVLSSSLRCYFEKKEDRVVPSTNKFALEFVNILNKYGLSLYDVTPVLKNSSDVVFQRQDEIKLWLLQHNDVENFVILDDETTFLIDFVGTHLIKLNSLPVGEMVRSTADSIGLGEEHIQQAVDILNCKVCNKVRVKKI